MSDAKSQTSAPAPAEAVWADALADGSGRHVPVRKHWPELAAALDAAVDGAVWDICSRCGEDEHPIPDWATWCMGCLDETGTATPAGAVPDTGQAREPVMTETSRALARRVTQYRRETRTWLKQAIMADGDAAGARAELDRERRERNLNHVAVPRVHLTRWAENIRTLAAHAIRGLNARDAAEEMAGRIAWWSEQRPDAEQTCEPRRWVCDTDPSRVEHTSFVGWTPCPSCRVIEPSGDTVQAPDVAAACPQHPPIPGHGDALIAVPIIDCPTCH